MDGVRQLPSLVACHRDWRLTRKRDPLDRAEEGIASFFSRLFGGGDVGTAKPGPVSKGEEFEGKVISSIEKLSEREEQLEKW